MASAGSQVDQLRRASRSIGAQIAEAWSKRRYRRYFTSKLTDAFGEQMETWHWIDTARSCGYLSEAEARELLDLTDEIGRMLNAMIRRASSFCPY